MDEIASLSAFARNDKIIKAYRNDRRGNAPAMTGEMDTPTNSKHNTTGKAKRFPLVKE